MKNPGAEVAQLTPDAQGWGLHIGGKRQHAASLAEAIGQLPPKAIIQLAVPTQLALLERMSLPSIDTEELRGMVQLQLEKTLPYPVEEVVNDFEVVNRGETESTLVSMSVHEAALVDLCQPLRDHKRIPQKITIYGQHVAALCPPDQAVLAIWEEQGSGILAICENGKLSWAQTLNITEIDLLQTDLSRILLSAEMEGVSTTFSRVLLGETLQSHAAEIHSALDVPVEPLVLDGNAPVPATNLLPPAWNEEAKGYERSDRIKQQLMMAAVCYLVLLAAAFVFLAFTKRKVQTIEGEMTTLAPQLRDIETRRAKWQALSPAIDPKHYPLELLFQATNARPSEELKITSFIVDLQQFTVNGEAPSAGAAIEYSEKLKSEPELSDFKVEMPSPPIILPNEHAQFRIFGRP